MSSPLDQKGAPHLRLNKLLDEQLMSVPIKDHTVVGTSDKIERMPIT